MKCPVCNQLASSWLRNSFSLQGVTLMQSIKGQLRCQNCKALLRSSKFRKQMWYMFGGMVFFTILIMVFSKQLYASFGIEGIAIYWIVLFALFIIVFMYGMWKYVILEKVEEEKPQT